MTAEHEIAYSVAAAARHRLAGSAAIDRSARCVHLTMARLYGERASGIRQRLACATAL